MKKNIYAAILGLTAAVALCGCTGTGGTQKGETDVPKKEETGQQDQSQEILTTEDPENPYHVEDGYYMTESLPAENFSYTLEYSPERGDMILNLKNISEQDYGYIQMDLLFYDENNQICEVYSGLYLYNLFAGSENILRFVPELSVSTYARTEILFSGDKLEEMKTTDPAGIRISETAELTNGSIVARCVNDTGGDVSMAYFRVDYKKDGKTVAVGTSEFSMLKEDREFLVTFSEPVDGYYNPLPEDFYDSWELTVVRVVPLS